MESKRKKMVWVYDPNPLRIAVIQTGLGYKQAAQVAEVSVTAMHNFLNYRKTNIHTLMKICNGFQFDPRKCIQGHPDE